METDCTAVGFCAQLTCYTPAMPSAYPVFDRTTCSVARAVDVLGDTWSLLVLRELFLGAHRFDQMQHHLGIARNILAARLNRLVEHGLIEKRLYQAHPPRFEYHLTRQGLDLHPVIVGLMQWGDRYLADPQGGPIVLEHRRCGQPMQLVHVCLACREPVSPRDTRARSRMLNPVALTR